MNKQISDFKNMIKSYLASNEVYDEKEIDRIIRELKLSPLFKDITESDISLIRKEIHAEYLITLDKGIGIILPYKPWFMNRKKELSMSYWERYKTYLLNDKGFSVPTVNTMDSVSDELTDLLGDPYQLNFQRRGLIIGDVQSGKTANYSGLICKAADAGYKVIVLLTGTIERLRRQTQKRIDEAFTGRDSNFMMKQKDVEVGVGKYDRSLKAVSFTTKISDFKAQQANNLGLPLDSLNDPAIFVIKKNVNALNKLNDWFKRLNTNGNNKIDKSLLMIDDESDNASINTNSEDRDPTKTNALIREMLSMFNRASYVGFTATPFANIFIDPETNEQMANEDLFPKDYIYTLNPPSNYIGARNIFPEEAKYRSMLKIIEDGEIYYPLDHKKEMTFSELSPSLCDAINTFLLANVIRDLRGDITAHRSMLVNISRFNNCQGQIYDLINNYLKDIQSSVKLYASLPSSEALCNKNIEVLKKTYDTEYSNVGFKWEDIQKQLYESIVSVQVTIVNRNNSGTLNYEENEENGLRIIAVGGLSLSRGLTLEGLVVSYFYRNSKMYDTLMQMGRWFGYRTNYEDLCRIWMSEENINWYEYISEATDELRRDVRRMRDLGLTPLDFGFRVRSDIDTLLVTARNKMRTSKEIKQNVSLSGEVVETPYIFNNQNKNGLNYDNVKILIQELKKQNKYPTKDLATNKYGFFEIEKKYIIDLLKKCDFPYANSHFDGEAIAKFIENYAGDELNYWDIVFPSGDGSINKSLLDGITIQYSKRSYDIVSSSQELIRISKSKIRLGSLGDTRFGLTKEEINLAKNEYFKIHNGAKTVSDKAYFTQQIKRKPLLLIYLIELNNNPDYPTNVSTPLVGLEIGIPELHDEKTKYATYKINKIFSALGQIDIEDGEE